MPFMTFTDGSVLTAAQVNDYLMRQAIARVTSSTRPASPTPGQVIYEFDTDSYMRYDGVVSQWQALAVGNPTIFRGSFTASPTGSTGSEQAIYRTDPFALKANRMFEIKLTGIGIDSTVSSYFQLRWRYTENSTIPTVSSTVLNAYKDEIVAASGPIFDWTLLYQTPATDITWQGLLTMQKVSGGAGTTTIIPTAGGLHIWMRDLGPTKAATGITF